LHFEKKLRYRRTRIRNSEAFSLLALLADFQMRVARIEIREMRNDLIATTVDLNTFELAMTGIVESKV